MAVQPAHPLQRDQQVAGGRAGATVQALDGAGARDAIGTQACAGLVGGDLAGERCVEQVGLGALGGKAHRGQPGAKAGNGLVPHPLAPEALGDGGHVGAKDRPDAGGKRLLQGPVAVVLRRHLGQHGCGIGGGDKARQKLLGRDADHVPLVFRVHAARVEDAAAHIMRPSGEGLGKGDLGLRVPAALQPLQLLDAIDRRQAVGRGLRRRLDQRDAAGRGLRGGEDGRQRRRAVPGRQSRLARDASGQFPLVGREVEPRRRRGGLRP